MPAVAVAYLGELPPAILTQAVRDRAAKVLTLAPETTCEMLTLALVQRNPDRMMQWLLEAGLLELLLPELAATVDLAQEGGRRHKDVWEHTKTVVWQSVPRPEVRWGAMLHDIGKVPTRRFTDHGKVTFHGHAEIGARMFRKSVCKRIGFEEGLRKRIEALILFHLRPGQYEEDWTDSAVRRFDKEVGPALKDLLDLSRADITTKHAHKRKANLRSISTLARRIESLRERDNEVRPLPAGVGNMMMEALGWPPGRHIGELRRRLEVLHAEGEIEGGREADYYLEVVRARDLVAGIEVQEPPSRVRGPRATDA